MKIKNKSVKPICFGDVNVLPGKTETIPDSYADSVDFYAKMNYVAVFKDESKSSSSQKSETKAKDAQGGEDQKTASKAGKA